MKDPRRHSVQRSLELYAKAQRIIPGATQLISRRPYIFSDGVAPIYATRGKGSRIWDVDGAQYVDYGMSVSACILGYADDVVDEAVKRRISDGMIFSLNSELELELAELLIRRIPCAEMVRYAKGGSDACGVAVRIARGTTGRDVVLFSGYHGWHDWYIAANLDRRDVLAGHCIPGIEPLGVPKALRGTAFPFPYGDVAALERLLEQHRGQVACIIMEPMRAEWPPAGYLQAVRALASREHVILIFDEVTTGFRFAATGLQEVLGVVPDMAIYAKSMSNGYPMGAVMGKRWAMEPAARMFVSSTYWSDLVGISAAIAALTEIERRDVPGALRAYGERLESGLREVLDEVELPLRIFGPPQQLSLLFEGPDIAGVTNKHWALVAQEMAKRGVLFTTHPKHCAAHTGPDLGITLEAFREALIVTRDAIAANSVDTVLEAKLETPVLHR
ncbi:MAG: aminotransferase class III-fold pyridoxal phosphate-dependent enzyme [Actinobacteria bacterium]|nr:aminotransferase class III-fold pyridoxal phosphate-dependent enzyme [Actinomycetota bacterium]